MATETITATHTKSSRPQSAPAGLHSDSVIELSTLTSHRTHSTSALSPTDATNDAQTEDSLGLHPPADVAVSSLPPVDRGRAAWSFLIAATTIEMIVWGLPYSVGVVHEYASKNMFPGQESTVTLAATLQNGLLLVGAGFFAPLFNLVPHYRVHLQLFGLAAGTLSLACSAFITKAWHLVLTLGILYPLSGALYMPCATLLYEWFVERRGLATGILFSGAAIGGTFFPVMASGLLSSVGYKGTMITLGAFFFVVDAVALLFIRRRVPLAPRVRSAPSARVRIDFSQLNWRATAPMWAYGLLTAFANFIPSLWMPTFATAVGATKPSGTALVAIMYAASFLGNLATGWLSDRYPVRLVGFASCIIAAAACLLLWGFGTASALLVVFSLVWGFTALSTAASWGKMAHIAANGDVTLNGLLVSLQICLRGVGNFASGPISTELLKSGALRGAPGAYGTNYGILLLYTGIVTLAGGLAAIVFPSM